MKMDPVAALAVASVFGGCQANLYALELIVNDAVGKELGNALTFLQFVGVTVLAFPLMVDWNRRGFAPVALPVRPRRLNRTLLIALALSFYLISVLNNVAFVFDVSVPLHAVFRSGSLIVSMAVGVVLLGKRYSAWQVACALATTTGVAVLTIATARQKGRGKVVSCEGAFDNCDDGSEAAASAVAWWWVGVGVLTFTTLWSAVLGVIQDHLYAEARRRLPLGRAREGLWREALFWSHAIPLPLFLLVGAATDNPTLGGALLPQLARIPQHLYGALCLNVLSQFVCICGVYTLVSTTSAFTMTLTITLRKFVSILVSIVTFRHYETFGAAEFGAIAAVMVAGSAYPFVPKRDLAVKS